MRTRRVYLTSVTALFVLAAGMFLFYYVFFASYYKASLDHGAYQATMRPIKLIFAFLLPASLIGIMACSLLALDHAAELKISTKTLTTVICLSILSFLFIIMTFPA